MEDNTFSESNFQNLFSFFSLAQTKFPQNEALIFCGNENEVVLKYYELNQRVKKVSKMLKNYFGEKQYIGIYSSFCIELILSILSILQISSSFVPIHPEMSLQMKRRIISNLQIVLVCSSSLSSQDNWLNELKTKVKVVLCIDSNGDLLQLFQNGNLDCLSSSPKMIYDDAYCMFSSGTTGLPKPVFVPHQCVIPNILQLSDIFEIQSFDTVLLASPPHFDPSIIHIFSTFSKGARLLVLSQENIILPNQLCYYITKYKVSHLQVTPSFIKRLPINLMTQILQRSELKILAFGGEQFPSSNQLNHWLGPKLNDIKIFNIYGTTEVSVWATIHRVSIQDLELDKIPLGNPLLNTEIAIVCSNEERLGEIWLGGKNRICRLDSEILGIRLRPTGDQVYIDEQNKIYYIGRLDRQIKIFGKRINLEEIQQVIENYPGIQACATICFEYQIHSFVSISTEKLSKTEMTEKLAQHIKLHLPKYAHPTQIHFYESLPLTINGKVDLKKLQIDLNVHLEYQENHKSIFNSLKLEDFQKLLWNVWKSIITNEPPFFISTLIETFLTKPTQFIDLNLYFVSIGGTSIDCVRIVEILFSFFCGYLEASEENKTKLFNAILHEPLRNCAQLLYEWIYRDSHLHKKPKLQHSTGKNEEFISYYSGPIISIIKRATQVKLTDRSLFLDISSIPNSSNHLIQLWKFYLFKCIDASPLIVTRNTQGKLFSTAYIGSHSGHILALDCATGTPVWITQLPDRIESSATINSSGSILFIGCYDQSLYYLRTDTGKIEYSFQTSGEIKCIPFYDTYTKLVLFGSYDGYLYALDEECQCKWKFRCSKSIFSSPQLDSNRRKLYCADLSGILYSFLFTEEEKILNWKLQFPSPIFSSPHVDIYTGNIFLGCCDYFFYCFDFTGNIIWKFQTQSPIYSSPSIFQSEDKSKGRQIVFGSHDGNCYSLNVESGKMEWQTPLGSLVNSSPFCILLNEQESFVVVAESKGKICVLSQSNGAILSVFETSGEIFSSPVVVPIQSKSKENWKQGAMILVGCRDNYLYSFLFFK